MQLHDMYAGPVAPIARRCVCSDQDLVECAALRITVTHLDQGILAVNISIVALTEDLYVLP